MQNSLFSFHTEPTQPDVFENRQTQKCEENLNASLTNGWKTVRA